MPNGGTDCCGNCNLNRAVQDLGQGQVEDRERFWNRSHCMLRDVDITRPFSTYCPNFSDKETVAFAPDDVEPRGRISGTGLAGYPIRIPWNGNDEPRTGVHVTCLVCRCEALAGIEVNDDGDVLGLCCDRHYVTWWKQVHEDEKIDPQAYGYADGDWGD